MAHCHYLLLLCNTATKENDDTLPSPSYSQTQRRQNTQKKNKTKAKRKEGTYFQTPVLPLHFWLPFLPFYFKRFLLASCSFQPKENKRKQKKKNHR